MGGAGSGSTPPPELVVLQLGVGSGGMANCMIWQHVIFISGMRVGSARPFRRLDLDCRFISEAGEAHERERERILQRHGSLLLKWRRESSEARAMERRHFGKARADRACFRLLTETLSDYIGVHLDTVVHYVALRWRNFPRVIWEDSVHLSFKLEHC